MPQPLMTGRIVWSELADANGIRKLRPAVIVTPTNRITPGRPLDVVAITSRLSNPLPTEKKGRESLSKKTAPKVLFCRQRIVTSCRSTKITPSARASASSFWRAKKYSSEALTAAA